MSEQRENKLSHAAFGFVCAEEELRKLRKEETALANKIDGAVQRKESHENALRECVGRNIPLRTFMVKPLAQGEPGRIVSVEWRAREGEGPPKTPPLVTQTKIE